jgi:putative sterol carrier protein
MAVFPTDEWIVALHEKLNNDEQYAHIAQKWEGDIVFIIEPGGDLAVKKEFYLDLWHGKCRSVSILDGTEQIKPTLTLKAPFPNFVRVLDGEWEPIQALMTRKLSVQGNMTLLVRNIPTVLDFVRCAREITDR